MITDFELTDISILPFPLLLWFPWLRLCIYTIKLSLILLLLQPLLHLYFSIYSAKATLFKFFFHVLKWCHIVLQNLSEFLRLALIQSHLFMQISPDSLPTFLPARAEPLLIYECYSFFFMSAFWGSICYWFITWFSLPMAAFPHSMLVFLAEHSPIILVCVSSGSGSGLLTAQKSLFSANYFLTHCEELICKYKYILPQSLVLTFTMTCASK